MRKILGHRWPRCVATSFLALFFLMPGQGHGQTASLIFGYPAEKNDFHDAAAKIIRLAYQRIGLTIAYKSFPAERALNMANKGQSDGELVRISGLSAKYPNLIQIPFSHLAAEQMAFGMRKDIMISGWKSLEPYKIAFDRGFKVAEKNTVGMNAFRVSSHETAFRMVVNGRVEIAVANRFTGTRLMRKPEFRKVIALEPPLQVSPLFHYINARHKQLVPRLVAALEEMRANGKINAIKSRYRLKVGK